MAYVRVVCHLVLLVCIYLSFVAARIDQGPDNVGAQVGSSVELKCALHHRSCDNVIWSKTDQSGSSTILYAGNNMLESYNGRYSVNVSPRRACMLHINRLENSDAGTFTCIYAVPEATQLKKSAVVTVIESKPQLEMNATAKDIVDGEAVTLTCSLKYLTGRSSEKNVRVSHPGATRIDRITKTDVDNEVSSIVTVRAEASKDTEERTLFGPIQCTVVFTLPENDAEFARNPVQFSADKLQEFSILSPVSNIWFDPDSGFSPGKPVTCKANGYPRPTVHWIRTSDNVTVSRGAKLLVKSANHTYMCKATNRVRGQAYTVLSSTVNFDASTAAASVPVTIIVSVVAAVIVVVIVLIVAVLVYRHKQKDARSLPGENKGGSGSYALVPTSTNQPLSTGHARDGKPSAKPGRPDIVPLRPAPPSKPVDSSRTTPIHDDEGGVVYAELEMPPAKPPRVVTQDVPETEYGTVVSA